MVPSFNLETVEGKMLNYYVQSQTANRIYRDKKCDTVTIDINVTELGKQAAKEHKKEMETCGGFLKTLEYKQAWRLAWNKAGKEQHKELLNLPNWNNEIFKEITGIDAEAEIAKE